MLAVFHEFRRYKNALTIPEDAQRTFRRRTREEHINGCYINIYTVLTDSSWFNLDFLTEKAKEEAKRIRDRLVNEVQGMEELPPDVMDYGSRTGLNSSSPEAQGLLSGEEEMLVPSKVGMRKREVSTPTNTITSGGVLEKSILL